MKIQSLVMMLIGLLLCAQATAGQDPKVIKLQTASGYATDAWLYLPAATPKNAGIVFLHGKRGSPETSHNESFIAEMVDLGYPVVAPFMPWSETRGYDGTRQQGMEVIVEAIKALPAKQVVIAGHSMGAMATLQFGAGEMPAQVIGLVSIAPGHDPNIAGKLRGDTESSARESCSMVKEGKGKEVQTYQEINGDHRYSIRATAEYYCSYFSTNEYPDTRDVVRKINKPVFLLSGEKDRLSDVYSHRSLSRSLPKNDKHKYERLSGNHISVLFNHTDVISKWIEGL